MILQYRQLYLKKQCLNQGDLADQELLKNEILMKIQMKPFPQMTIWSRLNLLQVNQKMKDLKKSPCGSNPCLKTVSQSSKTPDSTVMYHLCGLTGSRVLEELYKDPKMQDLFYLGTIKSKNSLSVIDVCI